MHAHIFLRKYKANLLTVSCECTYLRKYKGIYLSKALTCMKYFLYKQKLLFVKEKDTFGHIVV